MEKNKGFTLIELLAVIVILAVIALITTPIVLNVVENAKEKSNMNSAYGLIDVGRLYYSESLLNEEKASKIKKLSNLWNEIKVSGIKPKNGELYVSERGDVALSVIMDEICYQKTFIGELAKLPKKECGLGYVGDDTTAPEVKFTVYGDPFNDTDWAKDDFYVKIEIIDSESGVASYKWCSTTNSSCDPSGNIAQTGENGLVSISTESANNRICAIAIDNAGRETTVICSDPYKLDKTVPTIGGVTDLTIFVAYGADLQSGISVTDDLSGIDGSYTYQPTTIDTDLEGTHSVIYQVKDLAGNEVIVVRTVVIKQPFQFNSATKTITSYDKDAPKDVIIPNSINGVPVEIIGQNAFNSMKITSVTIPPTVTIIGNGAFNNNQLTSIMIPSSVTTIVASAFVGNKLTNITIPSSVTSIGTATFNNNQLPDDKAFIYARNSNGTEDRTKVVSYGGAKRSNVIVPSNVKIIENTAFCNNDLVSIIIPSSVKTIGNHAFMNNQLTSVTISSGVESIGAYAFSSSRLTSVTIPSTVTAIGDYAFAYNQLTNIKIIGKSSSTQFATYGSSIWGWASGYSDSNIIWNASS